MTEKAIDKDVVKFNELLLTVIHVQEAIIELLVEKGVIGKRELEVKTVQKMLEAKQGRHAQRYA